MSTEVMNQKNQGKNNIGIVGVNQRLKNSPIIHMHTISQGQAIMVRRRTI
jgi:copper(I)-binding protein